MVAKYRDPRNSDVDHLPEEIGPRTELDRAARADQVESSHNAGPVCLHFARGQRNANSVSPRGRQSQWRRRVGGGRTHAVREHTQ